MILNVPSNPNHSVVQSMINYIFTVHSTFNQICFALFLVKVFFFTLVSFFSIYANNKVLKKKGKDSLGKSTSPGVSTDSARVSAHVGVWPRRSEIVIKS